MPQHWGLQQCLQLTPPHTPDLAPQDMPQHWGLQQSVYSLHHPTLLPWLPKACHNTGVYNSVYSSHHPTLLTWLLKTCHNTGVYNRVFTAYTTHTPAIGSHQTLHHRAKLAVHPSWSYIMAQTVCWVPLQLFANSIKSCVQESESPGFPLEIVRIGVKGIILLGCKTFFLL